MRGSDKMNANGNNDVVVVFFSFNSNILFELLARVEK